MNSPGKIDCPHCLEYEIPKPAASFDDWYSTNCRIIIPAEDEIKSLMRQAFEAGFNASGIPKCICGSSSCRGCVR